MTCCSWDDSAALAPSTSSSSPQVEQEEQHDPDHVDEVPVERSGGQAEEALLRVDAGAGLDPERDQEAHADEDVDPVHPREGEERGAERVAVPAPDLRVRVLVGLAAEEPQPQDD